MNCPYCQSNEVVKNGSNGVGTPKFFCTRCLRQFVESPKNTRISDHTKELIDKLLLEKIPLAGIARVLDVSETWLQNDVNDQYKNGQETLTVLEKTTPHLTLEGDELWSFVGNSNNKQWVWLAMDRDTREIVGYPIGDRSAQSAQCWWDSLPEIDRQNAIGDTDFWEAYQRVFPKQRLSAVGKETGLTNHLERFNNTLRQRVSRWVRKTLSFSRKLENHIRSILYFIHYYNAEIHTQLLAA